MIWSPFLLKLIKAFKGFRYQDNMVSLDDKHYVGGVVIQALVICW